MFLFSVSGGGVGDRDSLVLHLRGGACRTVRHLGGAEPRHGGHGEGGGDQLQHCGGGAAGGDTVPAAAAEHGDQSPAAGPTYITASTGGTGEKSEFCFPDDLHY